MKKTVQPKKAMIFSFCTAIPTMSGYITKDLLSSHIKVCDPILSRSVEPDPGIEEAFRRLIMEAYDYDPPNVTDDALQSLFELIKDTASSMDINDNMHVKVKVPNWNPRTGKVKVADAGVYLSSKKKNIAKIRASEMLEYTSWMEDKIVGTGSRKVRGAVKARNICPESYETLTAQHLLVQPLNNYMLAETGTDYANARIAQGISSASSHVVASEVFASSSDKQAIVVDLDAANFDKTQHQIRPLQLRGFYRGILEVTKQLIGKERRLGYANRAELATGLYKEKMRFHDIRYYKQDTTTGQVLIMYPGNKSGSLDTTNVNNAVENYVFEYIKTRFDQDKGELMRKFGYKGEYKYIRMTANFLGDDYKSQIVFLQEIPDNEEFIRAVINLINTYIDEGPKKWGLEIHKEEGAVGWGVSNYIKISTYLGQYHANQPLSPLDTEKTSNTVM